MSTTREMDAALPGHGVGRGRSLLGPKLADAIGELIRRGYQEVALDIGAVEFMDSTGVRVLVDVFETLGDVAGQRLLQAASAPVRRAPALTGLDRLLALPDPADSPPRAAGPRGPC